MEAVILAQVESLKHLIDGVNPPLSQKASSALHLLNAKVSILLHENQKCIVRSKDTPPAMTEKGHGRDPKSHLKKNLNNVYSRPSTPSSIGSARLSHRHENKNLDANDLVIPNLTESDSISRLVLDVLTDPQSRAATAGNADKLDPDRLDLNTRLAPNRLDLNTRLPPNRPAPDHFSLFNPSLEIDIPSYHLENSISVSEAGHSAISISSLNGDQQPDRKEVNTILTEYVDIDGDIKDPLTRECNQCGFKACSHEQLRAHKVNLHSLKTVFNCDSCSFSTTDGLRCEIHLNSVEHGRLKHFEIHCRRCDAKMGQIEQYIEHRATHEIPASEGLILPARIIPDHNADADAGDEETYTCMYCDFTTRYRELFMEHLVHHTQERVYYCSQCSTYWSSKRCLARHKRQHNSKEPFKCEVCHYQTCDIHLLKQHVDKHAEITSENKIMCSQCDFHTFNASVLTQHMKKHLKIWYRCDKCDFKTTGPSTIKLHNLKHTGEQPFACSKCSFKHASKHALKRHLKTHLVEKKYQCSGCHYRTNDMGNLRKHEKRHQDTRERFKCPECDYSTYYMYQLNNHIRQYSGQIIKCDQCDFTTHTEEGLQKHQIVHRVEHVYRCSFPYCKFVGINAQSYKRHRVTHDNENQYRCSLCSYQCNDRSNYQRHMKLHRKEDTERSVAMDNGEKYFCNDCEFRTNSELDLKRHFTTEHHYGAQAPKLESIKFDVSELEEQERITPEEQVTNRSDCNSN